MNTTPLGKVKDAAAAWARANNTDLQALAPEQKKELIADVAASTKVPAIDVTAVLVGVWAEVNESRGLGVTKIVGEGNQQAGAGHKPLISANHMAPTGVRIANVTLGKVHTWNAPPADTPARQKSDAALKLDKAGNHGGAIRLYEEAMALDPADARIRTRLGLAHKHLGNTLEAKQALAVALALDPAFPPAHYNVACIAALEGDRETAVKHLREALRADKDAFITMAAGDKDFARLGGGDAVVKLALEWVH
ncbi:MAG: tetratricopeptide repeat protein [Deltaproteobacteria bacterium]|nr:tetratricopeptide repeat protein [Deltaproteobacteria bacterium]